MKNKKNEKIKKVKISKPFLFYKETSNYKAIYFEIRDK